MVACLLTIISLKNIFTYCNTQTFVLKHVIEKFFICVRILSAKGLHLNI